MAAYDTISRTDRLGMLKIQQQWVHLTFTNTHINMHELGTNFCTRKKWMLFWLKEKESNL